jgi:Glycosyl transferase family 90
VYIETRAYTTNLKQKMICGSPLLVLKMRYYEWWSRALIPGVHYIEISDGDDLCDDIVAKARVASLSICLCVCLSEGNAPGGVASAGSVAGESPCPGSVFPCSSRCLSMCPPACYDHPRSKDQGTCWLLKPIGKIWSYLVFRIGHLFPIGLPRRTNPQHKPTNR